MPPLVEITDTLDLHGFFPEQIPEVMEAFLENAREKGLKRLRVIHGKGRSRRRRSGRSNPVGRAQATGRNPRNRGRGAGKRGRRSRKAQAPLA